MKSPFAIFRKHQRILMVVTIGLSMFIFVICSGAGSRMGSGGMPKSLIALAIVCMFGGVAWLIGVPSKKSSETSVVGLIVGLAVAIALNQMSQPPVAVRIDSGNITQEEFSKLRRRREQANQFVSQAIFETRDQNQARMLLAQYQFGLGLDGNVGGDRDLVTTELLRREAASLGLYVPQQAVFDYINEITDNKMTPDRFKKIRQHLGLGEGELFEILESELQARLAAEFLYDFDFDELSRLSPTLPPEQYWEYYREIWVNQTAEVVGLRVDDFVDKSAKPPEEALLAMFNEYRDNFPNLTKTGELAEGRFGFMQPRKVQVGFVEVAIDDVRGTVGEVTPEEIEAYYQEHYVKPAEEKAAAEAAAAAQPPTEGEKGPALPELQLNTPETPETKPSGEEPTDASEPAAGETKSGDAAGAPSPAPESTPASDEGDAGKSSSSPDNGSALIPGALPDEIGLVALQAPPDSAAGNESTDNGDAEEKPADATDAAPDKSAPPASADADADATATTPAEPGSTEGSVGETEPAVPESAVPPLTEALREEIRTQVVRQRSIEKMDQIASEAFRAISDLGFRMSLPENNPQYLTEEQISAQIAAYANEHGLYYGVTPALSFNDLQESEEYPVGKAMVEDRGTVASVLSQSDPRDLHRPETAQGVNDSRFVFWKVADDKETVPDSLNEVREQVEKAWRQEQARTSVRHRAEELLELVRGADGNMEAALGGHTTTGDPDADALVVVPTGEFHWLSDPNAQGPNPFSFYPPRIRDPNGVTDAGPDFMKTVFNELAPGETGIAANLPRTEYYLVKILTRNPSGEAEDEQFRKEFMAQPIFDEFFGIGSVYQQLAARTVSQYRNTWVDKLWKKHDVHLLVTAAQSPSRG